MNTNFDDVADWLLVLGSMASPAEIHGQLVGQIVFSGQVPVSQVWLQQISEIAGVGIEQGSRYGNHFIELAYDVQAALSDEDFVFEPLLPYDDGSLQEQMEAFAEWCSGFVTGAAIVSAKNMFAHQLSEDSQEFYNDIIAISQLDPDIDEDASEIDFDTLVEYVRVGVVQLGLETLEASQPPSSEVLH